jgi:hypothetical protein
MASKAKSATEFPREGMRYEDRFRMTVANYGRTVVIELNRGTATISEDGKTVVIKYRDALSGRGPRAKSSRAKS